MNNKEQNKKQSKNKFKNLFYFRKCQAHLYFLTVWLITIILAYHQCNIFNFLIVILFFGLYLTVIYYDKRNKKEK